jgi:hypothetical protein
MSKASETREINRQDAAIFDLLMRIARSRAGDYQNTLLDALNRRDMSPADWDVLNDLAGFPDGARIRWEGKTPFIEAKQEGRP